MLIGCPPFHWLPIGCQLVANYSPTIGHCQSPELTVESLTQPTTIWQLGIRGTVCHHWCQSTLTQLGGEVSTHDYLEARDRSHCREVWLYLPIGCPPWLLSTSGADTDQLPNSSTHESWATTIWQGGIGATVAMCGTARGSPTHPGSTPSLCLTH